MGELNEGLSGRMQQADAHAVGAPSVRAPVHAGSGTSDHNKTAQPRQTLPLHSHSSELSLWTGIFTRTVTPLQTARHRMSAQRAAVTRCKEELMATHHGQHRGGAASSAHEAQVPVRGGPGKALRHFARLLVNPAPREHQSGCTQPAPSVTTWCGLLVTVKRLVKTSRMEEVHHYDEHERAAGIVAYNEEVSAWRRRRRAGGRRQGGRPPGAVRPAG
jgi:hypothetical protein